MPIDPHQHYVMSRRRQARFSRDVSRYQQRKTAEHQAQVLNVQRAQEQRIKEQQKIQTNEFTPKQQQQLSALRSFEQGETTQFSQGKKTIVPAGESYSSIQAGLSRQQLETSFRLQNIQGTPDDQLFFTSQGEKITKDTATRRLKQQRQDLTIELEKVKGYKSQDYQLRKTDGGGIEFFKTPAQIERETITGKVSDLKTVYDKPTVIGAAHAITTGLLSWEDPLGIKSGAQLVLGDRKGYLETKARASMDLDAALEQGAHVYALKSFTGPFATVGFSFAGGAGFHAAAGKATEITGRAALSAVGQAGAKAAIMRASPFILKGAMVAGGATMGGLAGKDIYETYKRDPLLAGAKAVTFAAAMYGGYKGWKSLKGTKWSIASRSQAAKKWYHTEHPKGKYKLQFKPFKKGIELTGKEPGRIQQMKQGIKQRFERPYKLTKQQKQFTREFAKDPSKFKIIEKPRSATDVLIELKGSDQRATVPKQALKWSDPKLKIDVVRGGQTIKTEISRVGIKAYRPGKTGGVATPKHFERSGPRLDYRSGIKPTFKGFELSGEGGKLKTRPIFDFVKSKVVKGRTPVIETKGGKRIYDFGYIEVSSYKDVPKTGGGLMPGPDDIPTGAVPRASKGFSFKGKGYDVTTGKWIDTPDAGVSISRGLKPPGSTGDLLPGPKGAAADIPTGTGAALKMETLRVPIAKTIMDTKLAPLFPVSEYQGPAMIPVFSPGLSAKTEVKFKSGGEIGGQLDSIGSAINLKPDNIAFVLDQEFKQPIKERFGTAREFTFKGDQGFKKHIEAVPETQAFDLGEINLRELQTRSFQEQAPEVIQDKYSYQISGQHLLMIQGPGLKSEFDMKRNIRHVQDSDVIFDVGMDVKQKITPVQIFGSTQSYKYAWAYGQTAGEVNIEVPELGGPGVPPFEIDLYGDDLGSVSGFGVFGRSRKHPIKDINIAAEEIFSGKPIKKRGGKSGRKKRS